MGSFFRRRQMRWATQRSKLQQQPRGPDEPGTSTLRKPSTTVPIGDSSPGTQGRHVWPGFDGPTAIARAVAGLVCSWATGRVQDDAQLDRAVCRPTCLWALPHTTTPISAASDASSTAKAADRLKCRRRDPADSYWSCWHSCGLRSNTRAGLDQPTPRVSRQRNCLVLF